MIGVAVREGLLAATALVFLGLMIASGGRGEREQFVAYEAAGVMQAPPATVQRIDLHSANGHWTLTRADQGWVVDGVPLATAASARLTTALQYLHATRPIRVLSADEIAALGEYGLATPRLGADILLDDGRRFEFAFGDVTPVDAQQYVHIAGASEIYLLSDFVGAEWVAVAQALP